MPRLPYLGHPTVDFCDGCGRVEVCDTNCYLDRGRQTTIAHALTLGRGLRS
jgi:hypothetical protein